MPQNIPPRGTNKLAQARIEKKRVESKGNKPQNERPEKKDADTRHYEAACLINGYRLLFEASKNGFITLNQPVMKDFTDDKGRVNDIAMKYAYKVWQNNCYDVIAACKLEGRHWRFAKDWKETGTLFVCDSSRIKRAS